MKLLRQIGLTLPVLRKFQACEACGETPEARLKPKVSAFINAPLSSSDP